jgi:hypothetical protein
MTESFDLDAFREGCNAALMGNNNLDDYLNNLVFEFGLLDDEMEEVATDIYYDFQEFKDYMATAWNG